MTDHDKDSDGYLIRELRDTEEDAMFAAKMTNECYTGGLAYKFPRYSVHQINKFLSNDFKNKPKEFYGRSFVLQTQKENVGFVQLMFHDSTDDTLAMRFNQSLKRFGIRETFWYMTGLLVFRKIVNIKPGEAYLYDFAVEENYRRRGYGKALLQKCDEVAISRNCTNRLN